MRKEGMRGSEEGRGLGSGGAVPLMGEWLHLCVCVRACDGGGEMVKKGERG